MYTNTIQNFHHALCFHFYKISKKIFYHPPPKTRHRIIIIKDIQLQREYETK